MNDTAQDGEKVTWPPILGLFKSVVVTLTHLRRNRVQAEIGEAFNVSQSTISRAIQAVTLLLGEVLAGYIPTAGELDAQTQYLVDGTLLPCCSWVSHPELYSDTVTRPAIQRPGDVPRSMPSPDRVVGHRSRISAATEAFFSVSARTTGATALPCNQ